MLPKVQSNHLKALIVKKSIINFEKRPSKKIMRDYLKNGIDSEFAKELIYVIDELKKHEKVKSIKLRSFLLNDDRSKTITDIYMTYGAKYDCKIANPLTDTLPFIATSLFILNFKNIKRVSLVIKEYIINL